MTVALLTTIFIATLDMWQASHLEKKPIACRSPHEKIKGGEHIVILVVCNRFILFNDVLDNIVDTIYICYAMDKDSGAVSQVEVHDIYLMLPVSRDQLPALAVQQA